MQLSVGLGCPLVGPRPSQPLVPLPDNRHTKAIHGQMARFDIMQSLPTPKFPGGAALRWPLLPLALSWYALRDKL